MKPRLISMLLTGLALALGLLLAVQISQNIRPQNSQDQNSSDNNDLASDLNEVVVPVIFTLISEQGDQLRLNGRSEPGATVSIEDHGRNIVDVVADENGEWAGTLPVNNRDNMVIDLVVYQENGAKIRSDEKIYRIPAPENIEENLIPQALLMLTTQGSSSRIIRSPFRGLPTDNGLSLGVIDYDDRGGAIISGASENPGVIRISANETVIGDTPVMNTGRWFYIAADTLPTGTYELKFQHINNNEVTANIIVPFERIRTENEPDSAAVSVQFDPFSWQIRRRLLGGGYQYTAIFAPIGGDPIITDP